MQCSILKNYNFTHGLVSHPCGWKLHMPVVPVSVSTMHCLLLYYWLLHLSVTALYKFGILLLKLSEGSWIITGLRHSVRERLYMFTLRAKSWESGLKMLLGWAKKNQLNNHLIRLRANAGRNISYTSTKLEQSSVFLSLQSLLRVQKSWVTVC